MVNMLAFGPKIRGFKLRPGDGILKGIKISSAPFFGEEVKPEIPFRDILRHVKNHVGALNKNTSQGQIHHLLLPFLLLASR
jgi:hypothetical protein